MAKGESKPKLRTGLDLSNESLGDVRRALRLRSSHTEWSLSAIEEALLSITSQTDVSINACFFVDALDEQSGNYQKLVTTLYRFANTGCSPNVNIKLRLVAAPKPFSMMPSPPVQGLLYMTTQAVI
jgi:hypothetical protein